MLFDPGAWLANIMQLTDMPVDFKAFVFVLVLGGLACAWIAERRVFVWLARFLGKLQNTPRRRKKQKEYKRLFEEMRMQIR